MKLLLLCLTLLFVSYSSQDTNDDEKKFMEIREKCIDESGVDETILEKYFDVNEYKDDKAFKCYFKCVMVSYNTMSEDGVLNMDNYDGPNFGVSEDVEVKVEAKCKDIKGSDPCETAYLLMVCIQDTLTA